MKHQKNEVKFPINEITQALVTRIRIKDDMRDETKDNLHDFIKHYYKARETKQTDFRLEVKNPVKDKFIHDLEDFKTEERFAPESIDDLLTQLIMKK